MGIKALNPNFTGSFAVGGADADLICGNTLIDIKTTWRGVQSTDLYQIIGYALLDLYEEYEIDNVALLMTRQGTPLKWSLDTICKELGSVTFLEFKKKVWQYLLDFKLQRRSEERRQEMGGGKRHHRKPGRGSRYFLPDAQPGGRGHHPGVGGSRQAAGHRPAGPRGNRQRPVLRPVATALAPGPKAGPAPLQARPRSPGDAAPAIPSSPLSPSSTQGSSCSQYSHPTAQPIPLSRFLTFYHILPHTSPTPPS